MVQKNVLAMSGKAVEAAGDVHVLLLDKTGTITLGNRQAVALLPAPGVDAGGAGATRRSSRRSPTRRRRGAASSSLAEKLGQPRADRRRSAGSRVRPVHRPDAHERRRRRRPRDPQGRRRSREGAAREARFPATCRSEVDEIARQGGTPLVVAEHRASARSHPSQGRRQGRPGRALQSLPGDGHPHGDDHRRQPAHRGGDRQGGGRRRLPGRRPRRRTSWRSSGGSRRAVTWWR